MQEQWRVYEESNIPQGQYEIIEILQNMDGTTVTLESKENKVFIKFNFVDALRVSDEGRRIKTYNEVSGLQRYRQNFIGIPLYLIDNSKFCQWIEEESAGFCVDSTHYAIVTINDIVDVISSTPPEIRIIAI